MSENNHPEGTRWIWMVFWILLIVTALEVGLGIIKPPFMINTSFFGISIQNLTFIIMTLFKAYYIVAFFMHLKHEAKSLIWVIALPIIILIPYLAFILLTEGAYIDFMIH